MQVCFGQNEYELISGSNTLPVGNNLILQLLADNIDFEELEEVLLDINNTTSIKIKSENEIIQTIEGFSKLQFIEKKYNIVYARDYLPVPVIIDEEEHTNYEITEHAADIIYVHMTKPEIADQVAANTANIEFIAIMSDIELE